ncbi:hypothetical protein L211DRAFT_866119 [Terfezia boudieri ATCC MYA-4762]|uniref:Uncharacterized protein n=1 Tax=Terfezia boudieri ATCC MYA-4762 TaxID=1051890 RepID=A0A3N4LWH7_9PEZI|nr:hypothetical protein L211DRAFT_866119 [Terfezia boudieri ATCC MYA-4762]
MVPQAHNFPYHYNNIRNTLYFGEIPYEPNIHRSSIIPYGYRVLEDGSSPNDNIPHDHNSYSANASQGPADGTPGLTTGNSSFTGPPQYDGLRPRANTAPLLRPSDRQTFTENQYLDLQKSLVLYIKEIENLKMEISELKLQNDSLKDRSSNSGGRSGTIKTRDDYRKKISSLTYEKRSMKKRLLQERVDRKCRYQVYEARIMAKYNDLNSVVVNLKKLNRGLEEKLSIAEDKVAKCLTKRQELSKEIECVKDMMTTLVDDRDSLREQLSQKERTEAKPNPDQKSTDIMELYVSELHIENQKLRDDKAEADRILQTIEEERRELQKTMALNNQTVMELQSKEQDLTRTVESQKRALKRSQGHDHTSDLADKYREELDRLRESHNTLSKLNAEHKETIKKVVSLRTILPRTEREVEELFNEFGDLGPAIASDELERLQTQLMRVVTERNNELLNLHKANKELQTALTRWLDAAEMARKSLDMERNKIKDLKAQYRALDEELRNARIRFAGEVEGTRKVFQEKYSQLEARLQEEVEKQQQSARERDMESKTMIDEVKKLRLWGRDLTQKLEITINGLKREKELRASAQAEKRHAEAAMLEYSGKLAAAEESLRLLNIELDKLRGDNNSLEVAVIKKKQEAIVQQNVIVELTQKVNGLEDKLYVSEEECSRIQKVNEALNLEAESLRNMSQALAMNTPPKVQAGKLEERVGIRSKGHDEDGQSPNMETGRTMEELKDELERARKALMKVSDSLVVAKNQVWNAVVMLAASGAQTCNSTWELPVREDQVKNKVSGRSYLTLLRAAKSFYHELLLVKQQNQELSHLLSIDNLSQAYFALLADYATLVKRLLVANLGSFPEQLPAELDGKRPWRVSGTCPIQRGDLKYWKSIVFDFLEISSAVPEDGVQPESPTAFPVEDRFGLARNGQNRWFDLQEVDRIMDKHREYAKKHEGVGHDGLGCIPLVIGMRVAGTEPLEKMVLIPKRVLNTWVHGSPELVKDIVTYLRVLEHGKMDFWENQYKNKGVFEFEWEKFFSEMEEKAKDRPRSIYEGGGGWLALRKDIQKIDPPRMSVWFPDDEKTKSDVAVGSRKCRRCTEISGAESKFFEQLNMPQKAAAAVSQVDSSSKSVAGENQEDIAVGSPNAAEEHSARKEGNGGKISDEFDDVEQSGSGVGAGAGENLESDEGWKKTKDGAFIEFKEADENERANYNLCKCICNTDGVEGNYKSCEQCVGREEGKVERDGGWKQQVEEKVNDGGQ